MPIIDLSLAQAVNQTVRDRFSKGYKSSNKVYYDGPIEEGYDYIDLNTLIQGDLALKAQLKVLEPRLRALRRYQQHGLPVVKSSAARMLERNRNARTAAAIRSDPKGAAALAWIWGVEPAGNCGEMARSAATEVRNISLARQSTYIGKLDSPGDHEFCVVAENPGQRLSKLSLLTNAKYSEWVVIDPWLNVTCTANNYLIEVGRQLKKWAGAGKHILWNEKFYRPTGTYKDMFAISGVRFTKFT